MEKKYWLGLKLVPAIDKRFSKIINFYETAEEVWYAKKESFLKINGVSSELANEIIKQRESIDLDKNWQRHKKMGIEILTIYDDNYPPLLKEIPNPPNVLFFKGDLIEKYSEAVAIVGSRRATAYGVALAEELALNLSEAGVTIVSGVARGIDSSAHRGALKDKGSTIGVLGCGHDVIYPPENKRLYETISQQGSLISEYPISTRPLKWNFPARNRIISGLSRGVVVVEASEKSGALITVDFALEQGREVFAVPGNTKNILSKGPHKLLKSGACLIETSQDILEELGLSHLVSPQLQIDRLAKLNEEEQKILTCLGWEQKYIDEIIRDLDINPSKTASLLTTLEIKGFIKQDTGKKYLRIH